MTRPLTIGVDVEGGDVVDGRDVLDRTIPALRDISRETPQVLQNAKIVLYGNNRILSGLNPITGDDKKYLPSGVTIHSRMNLEDLGNYSRKENTAMHQIVKSIMNGEIDGFYSIRDTIEIIKGLSLLGRIDGVKMPALVPEMPTENNSTFLFSDVGATTQSSGHITYDGAIKDMAKALYLEGLMTAAYAIAAKKIKRPRVGLLSNGTEEYKGSDLVQATDKIIRTAINQKGLDELIEYKGQQEMESATKGKLDILLCDGDTGNKILKSLEAYENMIRSKQFYKIMQRVMTAVSKFKRRIPDSTKNTGAVLLGYNSVVVKGHGNSDREKIKYGILKTIREAGNNYIQKMRQVLAKYG